MLFLLDLCVAISKWPSLLKLQSLANEINQVIMSVVVGVPVWLDINLLTCSLVHMSTQWILPISYYYRLIFTSFSGTCY